MEKTAKKPLGFYVCSMAFVLERFAFYSAKWLIAVFLVAKITNGGLGIEPGDAAKITANLVAFTYLAPIIGGYLSDRVFGARYLVPIGMFLMGSGYLVGWQANSVGMVNFMIVLVSLGTGLFKCQTNAITGRLFDDPRELDGAFSTQYSFVNVGAFLGTTIIGLLVGFKGYAFCFLVIAIVMFFNTIFFIYGWRFLGDTGKKPFKISKNKVEKKVEKKEEKIPLTLIEKKRVGAIILVSFFSIVFWILWYLAYMPVYYYWGGDNGAANWMIGNFQIPTAWFDSLNAFMCIALGPVLGKLWSTLAKRPKGDLSMFKKTALGMMLMGLSYLIFAVADISRGNSLAPIAWIIAFGIVLSMGEMVFSPLGNSFIAKFSPPRLLTMMMSIWVLAVFFAGKSYGYLYAYTLKFDFAKAYIVIAAIAIVSGIILWGIDKKLNNLVVEEKEKEKEKILA